MKNPKDPITELKKAMKPFARLNEREKNVFSIATKEPETVRQLIKEINSRTYSGIDFIKEDYTELKSAGMHYFTYRIIPSNNNITKVEYEQEMKRFKSDLADIARGFISKNYIKP